MSSKGSKYKSEDGSLDGATFAGSLAERTMTASSVISSCTSSLSTSLRSPKDTRTGGKSRQGIFIGSEQRFSWQKPNNTQDGFYDLGSAISLGGVSFGNSTRRDWESTAVDKSSINPATGPGNYNTRVGSKYISTSRSSRAVSFGSGTRVTLRCNTISPGPTYNTYGTHSWIGSDKSKLKPAFSRSLRKPLESDLLSGTTDQVYWPKVPMSSRGANFGPKPLKPRSISISPIQERRSSSSLKKGKKKRKKKKKGKKKKRGRSLDSSSVVDNASTILGVRSAAGGAAGEGGGVGYMNSLGGDEGTITGTSTGSGYYRGNLLAPIKGPSPYLNPIGRRPSRSSKDYANMGANGGGYGGGSTGSSVLGPGAPSASGLVGGAGPGIGIGMGIGAGADSLSFDDAIRRGVAADVRGDSHYSRQQQIIDVSAKDGLGGRPYSMGGLPGDGTAGGTSTSTSGSGSGAGSRDGLAHLSPRGRSRGRGHTAASSPSSAGSSASHGRGGLGSSGAYGGAQYAGLDSPGPKYDTNKSFNFKTGPSYTFSSTERRLM